MILLASSEPKNRAEPKKTTVSWICSRRKRASGSTYSDIIRRMRPSGLLRNSGFSYASGGIFSCFVLMSSFYEKNKINIQFRAGTMRACCRSVGKIRSLMIVNGLPEPQPEIEDSETAGYTANKSAGNEVPEIGKAQEERIVSPLGRPGKDQEQNPEGRA